MHISKQFLFKKTKIVCTIGPACQETDTLVHMVEKGMNLARLNCSHGDHETLSRWIRNIRETERRTGVPVPIILDLQGPKIRIGKMKDGNPVMLTPGSNFIITTEDIEGTSEIVSTAYKDLPQAVSPGNEIFINDGLVRLRVNKKTPKEIHTVVLDGGVIANHKGINVPGGKFKRRGLTEKDRKDIAFGLKHDVEFIAVSFVEKGSDIRLVNKALGDRADQISVIAKIERQHAVEKIDEILSIADGIMVARGDLGVEIKLEKVPLTQKEIIRKAMEKQRRTIVATQMLESMTYGPTPTRAEVSDVANSILDNPDGLMLSAETAMGKNPIDAVKMMSRIAHEIEKADEERTLLRRRGTMKGATDAVTWSAVEAADALGLDKIIVFTETGRSARSIALRRPRQKVIAFSPNTNTLRRIQLLHGILPVKMSSVKTFERLISNMEKLGRELDLIKNGENVILVAGPPGVTGGTNLLKVHKVGES